MEQLNLAENISDFVQQPSWKEMLLDLIHSNNMNPWDIDLSEITEKYIQKIRSMKSMDLRIPANVILASSILLKFKTLSLMIKDEPQEAEPVEIPKIEEEIPNLVFKPTTQRARRVTLDELVKAVEEVLNDQLKPRQQPMPKAFNITIKTENVNTIIKRIYDKMIVLKDSENLLLFSQLKEDSEKDNYVRNLLPLMHLMQDRKLNAWQEEVFGDIIIQII
ncbi:MAG: segregation/condensation protein A [Candidatus Marsarchaeota archaeon]|nr:segregation/condensation protein A [Candidatus Marsarchaeota archaeon]